MILYASPLSPYAARVRFSLWKKGLEAREVKPSELGGMNSQEFLAIAPLGKIPVLVLDDGTRIAESETIVEYLEELCPEPPLLPEGAEARARARMISRVADLHIVTRLLQGGRDTKPIAAMMPLAAGRIPEPRDGALVDAEAAAISRSIDFIAANMVTEGPFALGDRVTVADAALVVGFVMLQLAHQQLQIEAVADRPIIGSYLETACGVDRELARMRAGLETAFAQRANEIRALGEGTV